MTHAFRFQALLLPNRPWAEFRQRYLHLEARASTWWVQRIASSIGPSVPSLGFSGGCWDASAFR